MKTCKASGPSVFPQRVRIDRIPDFWSESMVSSVGIGPTARRFWMIQWNEIDRTKVAGSEVSDLRNGLKKFFMIPHNGSKGI